MNDPLPPVEFDWVIGCVSMAITILAAVVFGVFQAAPPESWGFVLFVLFWGVFFWTYVAIDLLASKYNLRKRS